VAGFDFEFEYHPTQEALLEVCLAAAKSRARKLGVSWRVARLPNGHVRCTVDGNSRRLDLLAHALERDLPLVAEGAHHCHLPTSRRRQLGTGFADLYGRGRDIHSDGPWQWRGATQAKSYFSPYDATDRSTHPTLDARLAVTESILIDWCFERVPAVVLLEELHTACELLLEHLINQRSKRRSFAELVDLADGAGLLRHPMFEPGALARDAPTENGRDLLLQLKDYRKNARHRADTTFEQWLTASWETVALLIEHLASASPVAAATTATADESPPTATIDTSHPEGRADV